MLTDERIKLIWESMPHPTFTCQGFARLIEAEVLQAQEPVGYANGDELDNMLDDRSITISARPNGFQRTPIFTTPQPPAPCQCAELRAEVERLTKDRWCPTVCPITGRPFFMWIEHYESGCMVPTYGGPFDSYTIPIKGDDGEFVCERYDHDAGAWLTDEVIGLGLRLCDDQHEDYEFGTLAARDATIAQQAERIAELERLTADVSVFQTDYIKECELNIKHEATIAQQAALIEKCEKALEDVPDEWRHSGFGEALAAITTYKGTPK